MPAEWAPHERTIMGWPCRRELWGDQLGQAKSDYAATANAGRRPAKFSAANTCEPTWA